MDWKKLTLFLLLSAALVGAGCGGDDSSGEPGGGDGDLGDTCEADDDCASGICEASGHFCTEVGDPATGCTDTTCPSGFTCVWWGAGGGSLCSGCPEGAPRPVCIEQAGSGESCSGGTTKTYVLSVLNIGQADPSGEPDIVPGFNLDGRVSDGEDYYGCYHEDFTSPAPDNEPGVDNQLGPVLTSVGSSIDIEGTIAEQIMSGDLLILLSVSGIDGDLAADDCVTVSLELGTLEGTGATAPEVDGDGVLVAGQTFNVDERSVGLVESVGEIVAGRLRAGPVDVELSLPIEGSELTLNIRQALLRFNVMDTSISNGLLGGSLDTEETVSAIVSIAPDDIPEGVARSVLQGQADLLPDTDTGACQAVSIGLVYDGVEATRGDVVTVP